MSELLAGLLSVALLALGAAGLGLRERGARARGLAGALDEERAVTRDLRAELLRKAPLVMTAHDADRLRLLGLELRARGLDETLDPGHLVRSLKAQKEREVDVYRQCVEEMAEHLAERMRG